MATMGDVPNWAWALNGAGDPSAVWIDHQESGRRRVAPIDAGFASGTWVMLLTLPTDLAEIEPDVDPLLMVLGLSDAGRRLGAKLADAVHLCRIRGRSWAEIGRGLGVTKQSAHQRFAGTGTA